MSAQIKEALSALDSIKIVKADEEAEYIVRSALEAAQQEAEAWEAIEAWQVVDPHTPMSVGYYTCGGSCYFSLGQFGKRADQQTVGSSRLEALTKAAAWCRAELAK